MHENFIRPNRPDPSRPQGRAWVIAHLGATGAEEAIRIVNASALAGTDPRDHWVLLTYLEGRAQPQIAKDLQLSTTRIRQIVRNATREVRREIDRRARPDHLLRSVPEGARAALLFAGLETDRAVRDHVAAHGARNLRLNPHLRRGDHSAICEAFGFDPDDPGPDLSGARDPDPITAEQTRLLNGLADGIGEVLERDEQFEMTSLRLVMQISGLPFPVGAAQVLALNGQTFEDARYLLLSNSDEGRRRRGRIRVLQTIRPGRKADPVYTLSEDGQWLLGRFDQLFQGEGAALSRGLILALDLLNLHAGDLGGALAFLLTALRETRTGTGVHLSDLSGPRPEKAEDDLEWMIKAGLVGTRDQDGAVNPLLTHKGRVLLSEVAEIMMRGPTAFS
jgi:hypothetical protein